MSPEFFWRVKGGGVEYVLWMGHGGMDKGLIERSSSKIVLGVYCLVEVKCVVTHDYELTDEINT